MLQRIYQHSRQSVVSLLLLAVFVVGAVLATTALSTARSSSGGTAITVSSASLQVGQAATTGVSASLSASDSANAFDITLTYDPSVITVRSLSLPANWIALATTYDNATGTLRVAAFQFGSGCAPGTACELFAITWSGVSAGTSTVHLASEQLVDGGVALAAVATVDGVIKVRRQPHR